MVINLLILPLFIENLGKELYGIWVLSNVVLGYLNVFDLGFTQGLQKYVAEASKKSNNKELSEVVVSGFVLLAAIGFTLGLIAWLSADLIARFFRIKPENHDSAVSLIRISAFFCVLIWPFKITTVILNATMRIKEAAWLNTFTRGSQTIAMLAMVLMSFDIVTMKWVASAIVAGGSGLGLVVACKLVPEIEWRFRHFKTQQLRRMHKFSLGMFYLSVLVMLSVKIDTLVVGRMLNMEMVAVYAIIAKPFEVVQVFGRMVMRSLMPAAYNVLPNATSLEKENLICNAVKYRTISLVPISIVAIWATPSFLHLWVGEEYVQYSRWAQLFIAVHFFMGIASLGNVARADGAMLLVNAMLSLKVFLNVMISIALTFKIGIGGVVAGTFLSNVFFGELVFGNAISRKVGIPFSRVLAAFLPAASTGVLLATLAAMDARIVDSWILLAAYSVSFAVVLIALYSALFLRSEFKQLYSKS